LVANKPVAAKNTGVAHLDGHGLLDTDMGGSDSLNGLRVWCGDGRGGFTLEIVPLDHGVRGLNGDGSTDIVTTRFTSSQGEHSGFEVLFWQDCHTQGGQK
jgi:hypothetical protein